MKLYYILFLLVVGGLIFVIANPNKRVPQAQEEPPKAEQIGRNTFRIKLDIEENEDNSLADIIWFQKAAEVALAKNTPWFNVLEQKMSDSTVEGVIQLERDPMKAEYDANEILSLQLTDEVAE
jgi:hypothetical protein